MARAHGLACFSAGQMGMSGRNHKKLIRDTYSGDVGKSQADFKVEKREGRTSVRAAPRG